VPSTAPHTRAIGCLLLLGALLGGGRACVAASEPLKKTGNTADTRLACYGTEAEVDWVLSAGGDRATLDLWCDSVGPPVVVQSDVEEASIAGLTIVSWNIHVGGGRVNELVRQLRSGPRAADDAGMVLLVQEAFRSGTSVPRSYPARLDVPRAIQPERPVPDVAALARSLKMFAAYVPSMRNGTGAQGEREDRGNAILSTEPLSDIRAFELPFGKQRRVAVAATVTPRGHRSRPMRVVSIHLDTNGDRVEQAAAAGRWLGELAGDSLPIVAGGDLNSHRGRRDGAFKAVSAALSMENCGDGSTHTWPLRLDRVFGWWHGRLDFIFSSLDPSDPSRRCLTLGSGYGSDHRPVMLVLGPS
jgi:endonuclease/exonuclease/phosphatase family metal-dependent hydrolase